MSITIVNLTLLKVNEELVNLSGRIYPAYTYQKILTNPKLRQKLLDYVLSRIPNHYAALSSEKIISISPESLHCSTSEKLSIGNLVQQAVVNLILSGINKNPALRKPDAV